MATTTKLDKKQLKAPDEFQTLGSRAAAYVAENAALVLGGTLLVLALIAGAFGWFHQQREREVEASGKLYEGEKLLGGNDEASRMFGMAMPGQVTDENRRKAIEVFEQVAQDYPGSAAARRARLKAGDVHLELKEWDKAIASYEQALAGALPEEVFYARNGMAHAYEAKESWDDAAATYRKIADDESLVLRDLATLDLARVLVRAGKTEEARTVLSKFGEKFPDSALKQDADKELAKVGGPVSTPAPAGESTPGSAG